jgi:predicted transcriptional regulator
MKNARWAITGLKRNQLIEAKQKNQYLLTAKGREAAKS